MNGMSNFWWTTETRKRAHVLQPGTTTTWCGLTYGLQPAYPTGGPECGHETAWLTGELPVCWNCVRYMQVRL